MLVVLLVVVTPSCLGGSVFFRQGGTRYDFTIPDVAPPLVPLLGDDVTLSESQLRSRQAKPPLEEGVLLRGEEDVNNNEIIQGARNLNRKKKRPRRPFPLCSTLRWPYVTAVNPVPCVADKEPGQGLEEGRSR